LATLVGEPGTGKSTILKRLIQSFDLKAGFRGGPQICGILIYDTSMTAYPLLRQIATELGVQSTHSAAGVLRPLVDYFKAQVAQGKTVAILIDEAQMLTPAQFDEVRLLTNLEVPGRKLVEVVLAGQAGLENKLASPELAALRQRISVKSRIQPLDEEQAGQYIKYRISVAASRDADLFAPDAIELIHKRSRGIPRIINIICDRALLVAYTDEAPFVDLAMTEEAINELRVELEAEEKQEADGSPWDGLHDNILSRLSSRMDVIEGKLDMLLDLMQRRVDPQPSDARGLKRWLGTRAKN
jgi:general secretion pathway protein A